MRWKESSSIRSPNPLPSLHPLVAQALIRQGISTPKTARAFLDPDAYSPTSALDMPGLPTAAELIEDAIRSRKPICVWGDFDVDGQTSTTVLYETLLALGADATYHIPVRAIESHGINLPHLKIIIDQGAQLILTCDTGITAFEAGEYTHSVGVDLVITDHHDLLDKLPLAAAVVNPKLLPSDHALATLSGVGVAYKLAEELYTRFPSGPCSPSSLHDLVALGLVADLAILKGDTRFLVQLGLKTLRNTQRLGLQIMMEMAELAPSNLTEEHIGFILGPRFNALGRLGDANSVVELLTTNDAGRARMLATQLENYNTQRRLLCTQVMQAAEAQLRSDPTLLEKPVLVLWHPAWHGGVVGIVASRLVERYHKPTILLSAPNNELVRGSARSIEGLNITSAIATQKDLLINFGGHPMAAGLALEQVNLPIFIQRLSRTVEDMLGETARAEKDLRIDAWLDLTRINLDLATDLENLAPYGPGNEELTLATSGLTLQSVTPIGDNKEHLKLAVVDEIGNIRTVIWWSGAANALPVGKFDLAFTLRATGWRGNRQAQIEFVDFRNIETQHIDITSPKHEIVDYRNISDPLTLLPNLRDQPSTLIWVEAEAKKEIGGNDRNELVQANNLVIWTIPPSPEEFLVALDTVRPKIITLIGAHPNLEVRDTFMLRLTGLLKYAISHHAGKVTFAELAAATSQRRITIDQGLKWLASRGTISLEYQPEDQLLITPGGPIKYPGDNKKFWGEIQALLAETAAYRAHFKRADHKMLFM
jgi:single-stranded-DNA-specific exonuclease